MVREFERYYTDRTVPETRAGAVRRRMVVEERLVYAEVFGLASLNSTRRGEQPGAVRRQRPFRLHHVPAARPAGEPPWNTAFR